MHLSKLELKGFKSFKDKTVLQFPDKFTAIIGPNGSGKSNLTEAVCFVLGKSRGLRASNLQELIFNGGIHDKPADNAVVSIYFKDDGKEVKLTRKIDRKGQSLYELDGKRTTREKILGIVGDNEYNIILQDDVTKVIDMKSVERRQIIDDLCGIAEYDKKKEKALRELDKVENRISDTNIILGEKFGYLNALKKERDDALEYQDVRENLRKVEATLLDNEIKKLDRRKQKIEENFNELLKEKKGKSEEIQSIKNKISELNNEIKELNKKIFELEGKRGGGHLIEVRGNVTRLEEKNNSLQERINEGHTEIQELREKKAGLEKDEKEITAKLGDLVSKLTELNKKIDAESSGLGDSSIEKRIDSLREKDYSLKSRIQTLNDIQERIDVELSEINQEKTDLNESFKSVLETRKDADAEFSETIKKHESKRKLLDNLKERYDTALSELKDAESTLETKRIELTRKTTELETIRQAGDNKTVEAVLKLKDVIPGIHGPVYQLGDISESKYDSALKIAAGPRIRYIIVEDTEVATKCIKYLRDKEIGRATFLPLDKINIKLSDGLPKDAIGYARNFVKCQPKFKKVIEYVYGDTVLVEDIDTARDIGVGSNRMVTLDGDLIEKTGAMTGGFLKRERIEIVFSNIDELERKVATLEEEFKGLEEITERRKSNVSEVQDELSGKTQEADESSKVVDRLQLKIESITGRESELKDRQERLDKKIKDLTMQKTRNASEIESVEEELQECENQLSKLIDERGELDTSILEKLKDDARDLSIEETKLKERKGLIDGQLEEYGSRLDELGLGVKTDEGQLKSNKAELDSLKEELGELEEESKNLVGDMEDLMERRSIADEEIQELSSGVGEIEHSIEKLNESINNSTISKTQVETRLDDLKRSFTKYEGVELIEGKISELERTRMKLEERMERMGSVNLKAIENYDKVKKEYDDITEKLETLKTERQSIYDFMGKVESRKRETFMETFDLVKENFERIFPQLSDNGRGTIILDNPKSISESGLLINASPGGKKVMGLDAMSGGEKVLTSSAFLLAIQQYKPSHFYIVDELDAALDKENSVKLAEMLQKSDSQFILVTHNDSVMRYAKSVIGVSMNRGVSQIVGVRLT